MNDKHCILCRYKPMWDGPQVLTTGGNLIFFGECLKRPAQCDLAFQNDPTSLNFDPSNGLVWEEASLTISKTYNDCNCEYFEKETYEPKFKVVSVGQE